MGFLPRSLIQIKPPVKLSVDAEAGPAGAARSFRSGDAARGEELSREPSLLPNFEPVNVRAYRLCAHRRKVLSCFRSERRQ